MAVDFEVAGRGVDEVSDRLMTYIQDGRCAVGKYLPSVRALSGEVGLSAETVRRGLKRLERDGLVAAHSRKGFRVLAKPVGQGDCRPVAYVTSNRSRWPIEDPTSRALASAFQDAVAGNGWSVLGVHVGEPGDAGDGGMGALDQIRAGNAWGLVLDTLDARLQATVERAGLPTVMVNSWREGYRGDVVLQDNYLGGFLAAQHLAASGARRVGWVGQHTQNCHSRERYAGARAALDAAGLELISTGSGGDGMDPERSIRLLGEWLAAPDGPDSLLAFYPGTIRTVVNACSRLGRIIGRDLPVVGWVAEELYETLYLPLFGGGAAAPAIVWKASSMVRQALALLAGRRQRPNGEWVRVCVPTQLRTGI